MPSLVFPTRLQTLCQIFTLHSRNPNLTFTLKLLINTWPRPFLRISSTRNSLVHAHTLLSTVVSTFYTTVHPPHSHFDNLAYLSNTGPQCQPPLSVDLSTPPFWVYTPQRNEKKKI